jgi:hypothetical protein
MSGLVLLLAAAIMFLALGLFSVAIALRIACSRLDRLERDR